MKDRNVVRIMRFTTVFLADMTPKKPRNGWCVPPMAPLADKAFDSNDIIADLNGRGAKIVISQHPRRTTPLQIDTEMYKWRHLIENFFCKLKEFKRIAMRADKTDQSFPAMIHLAAAVINSR